MSRTKSGIRRFILAFSLLNFIPNVVLSQTTTAKRVFSRYRQFVWNDQHGLPQNSILSIVQTRDGYLWLGTAEGAVRFDGVNFTTFDAKSLKQDWSVVTALVEDRSGGLWIGLRGHALTRLKDNVFVPYRVAPGSIAHLTENLFEDRAGNLWIATTGGGLLCLRDGRMTSYGTREGLPSENAAALAEDDKGNLWVGTSNGLALFRDGRIRVFTKRDGMADNSVTALCVDRHGVLWIGGADGGLTTYSGGRFQIYATRNAIPRSGIRRVYCDRGNRIWIGTSRGLVLVQDGNTQTYTAADGLPDDDVQAIYEDGDGNMWIGTQAGGLCQLKEVPAEVYGAASGLLHDEVRAVFESRDGSMWFGTMKGWNQMKAGLITTPTWGHVAGVNTITQDPSGDLWVATSSGLTRMGAGRRQSFRTGVFMDRPITSLLADHAGNIWVGTSMGGLCRFRDGVCTGFTTKDGLAHNYIVSLYQDRADAIWIATLGGVSRFQNGRLSSWTTRDGLASNEVACFHQDRTGVMWIGTQGGGLSRFKNGRFANITVDDGLYDNLAFQILEDDRSNFWMSSNRGVYRVSLSELNDFADGRSKRVSCYSYGIADGMLSRECNGAMPAGVKSVDGRVWFGTLKGAVAFDPRLIRTGRPPKIAIEHAIVDGRIAPAGQRVRLNVGDDNLEIKYTGLSWDHPRDVRFKVQLAGLDRDWIDVGTRRSVYYSHLPPGRYTFRVIADNGNGSWNLEGQSLPVTVIGPYYKTWWFLALMASVFAGLLVTAVRFRLSHLAHARAVQQAFARQLIASQESERKRIAAELHDSLGQRLVIMKNLALLHLRGSRPSGSQSERVEDISKEASRALEEIREISYAMRPYQLDRLGLTKAVEALIGTVSTASETAFSSSIDNVDDFFPQDLQINFYRIVQECLNNIVKHSAATRAGVRVWRDGRRLFLEISDDGIGFAPNGSHSDSRKYSFGLTGISERVQLLGGSLEIQAEPGQGTKIHTQFDLENLPHAG